MHRRSHQLVLLVAWLMATGVHWDVLQLVAWGRMFGDFSKTETVAVAVKETLDPANRCQLCIAVAHGKEEQERAAVGDGRVLEKLILLFQPPPALVVAAPGHMGNLSDIFGQTGRERAAPPLPPPRELLS